MIFLACMVLLFLVPILLISMSIMTSLFMTPFMFIFPHGFLIMSCLILALITIFILYVFGGFIVSFGYLFIVACKKGVRDARVCGPQPQPQATTSMQVNRDERVPT